MHEYYFRECMTPLVNNGNIGSFYHFMYGSHGTEYIAKRRSYQDFIKIKAIGYMDYTQRKKFINGYTRLAV